MCVRTLCSQRWITSRNRPPSVVLVFGVSIAGERFNAGFAVAAADAMRIASHCVCDGISCFVLVSRDTLRFIWLFFCRIPRVSLTMLNQSVDFFEFRHQNKFAIFPLLCPFVLR